jgi:uncharacterized protein YqjF (DUF2071 family)
MASLMDSVQRQAAALRETAHRPWPPPRTPWILGQTWLDQLFAHWPVPVDALRAIVPPALSIDSFDGSAWLGMTPFRVSGLRFRGTVPLPLLSTFLELNVRTYVTLDGKPGVFLFSVDASSRPAVEAARRLYKLPYFHARISAIPSGDHIEYWSRRTDPRSGPAELKVAYRPAGQVFQAGRGTIEEFLTERYCLYTADAKGALWHAEIHHPPWPLQEGECAIDLNTMPPRGVHLASEQPLMHYAARTDVVIWPLRPTS